jgi:hypothetical protein
MDLNYFEQLSESPVPLLSIVQFAIHVTLDADIAMSLC